MAEQTKEKTTQQADPQSELLPAMLAIVLGVAAQLALNDGLTLLGLAGYSAAAWLFVSSVRTLFDVPVERTARQVPPTDETIGPIEDEIQESAAPAEALSSVDKVRYLRRHWRQVTLAEIFTGQLPPARLGAQADAAAARATVEPELPAVDDSIDQADTLGTEQPGATPSSEAQVTEAQMKSWSTSVSASSAPRSVKVTAQGDVLVLDTGLEQVQHFDEQGNLLATYSVAGLADVAILDLDVSPDGRTLYIVDAASRRLQIISLSEVDSADDVQAGSEEE